MQRLSRYLAQHFFSSLLSFFIPLFGIASLIFFVKIVSITAYIHINFLELFQLYFYVLPQILFFTLSITFFIAAVSATYRLSYDFELIALFALGISPKRLVLYFLKNAALFSAILLIFGLLLIPQAKQLYKGFLTYKRHQMQLNIKPSEFGHKFGDWYLFMKDRQKNRFVDVALYSQKFYDKENFIVAKSATIQNDPKGILLTLYDGNAYSYDKEVLQIVNFKKLQLLDRASNRYFYYQGVVDYWKNALQNKQRAFDLTFFLFLALFPLAALFFIPFLGVVNTRYERKNIFLNSLATTLLYFAIAFGVSKPLGFYALLFLPLWLGVGFWLYKQKVAKRY